MPSPRRLAFLACLALIGAAAVHAQAAVAVAVEGAWARAVMPGQAASSAYMVVTAREPLTLTGAASPAAGIIEIHQMWLDGDVMKMRAVDTLPLVPGQPVAFKPGGYHFMLMDLKAQFRPGTSIPLTLQFRDARGATRLLKLSLPVASAAPQPKKP